MKAIDLMIGDWIGLDCAIPHFEDKVVRIEQGIMPCQVVKFDDYQVVVKRPDKQFQVVLYDAISPISLTKEVLEKNGFVDMDGGQYRWFSSDDECYYFGFSSICYYTHSNFLNMTKEHQSGNQQQVKGFFEYVHELQHAIKLCGIEKEIEL